MNIEPSNIMDHIAQVVASETNVKPSLLTGGSGITIAKRRGIVILTNPQLPTILSTPVSRGSDPQVDED